MKRLLLVDDHGIIREGLKLILQSNPAFRVTDEAHNRAAALEKVLRNPFDAVLLDLTLPDMSGIEVLQRLRPAKPQLPVLVLSMHAEDQYVLRALRAGANGYLTKESASAELLAALDRILNGRTYLSPALAERLALELARPGKLAPHEALSEREAQVFALLVKGASVKEIGVRLGVSAKTISTHRARILEKMGMESNAELAQYAVRNNLV